MASPKKRDNADSAYVVKGSDIVDVFTGVLGDDVALTKLSEEFHNLTHAERLILESRADSIAARKARRKARRDEQQREEEARRLWERRNNPENLNLCATTLQRYFRMVPLRQRYQRLLRASLERPRKRAIVVCISEYDDPRARPPLVVHHDGYEMARALQFCGFSVDLFSSAASNPALRPTKANLAKALQAATAPDKADDLLWVHVCGAGGAATVSGRNPFKLAQHERMQQQTPRTRMICALRDLSSKEASGVSTGDVARFVLPCDAKTTRLTYDSVLSFDEIIDVVDPRHSEKIHGRQLAQRVVSIDVECVGAVEGLQGGGFGVLASTASPLVVVEPPPEESRGLLSACLLRCLLGHDWVRKQLPRGLAHPGGPGGGAAHSDFESTARSLQHGLGSHAGSRASMSMGNTPSQGRGSILEPMGFTPEATLAREQGTASDHWLTVHALRDAVLRQAERVGAVCKSHGAGWGEIPLLGGERVAAALASLERTYAAPVGPLFGVLANEVGPLAQRKRRLPAHLRSGSFETTVRVDVTKADRRPDIFGTAFTTVLLQWLQVMAQPDPTLPLHRQAKLATGKAPPRRTLRIALDLPFHDLATRVKVRRGAESQLWAEVASRLLASRGSRCPTREAAHRTHDASTGKSVTLPPLSPSPVGSQPSPSPSHAQPVAPVVEEAPFRAVLGAEEGTLELVIPLLPHKEDLEHVLDAASELPRLLPGVKVTSLTVDIAVPLYGLHAAQEQLRRRAHSWYPSRSAVSGGAGWLGGVDTGHKQAHGRRGSYFGSPPAHDPHTPEPLPDEEEEGADACAFDSATLERLLALFVQHFAPFHGPDIDALIMRVAAEPMLAVRSVVPLTARLNDLDDVSIEACMRRERPVGSAAVNTHTGIALCVVALTGSADLKMRQALQIAHVAPRFEAYCGIKFLIWDLAKPVKAEGGRRARLEKLLSGLLSLTPSTAYPALFLLDLFKRRYYRARLADSSSPSPSPPRNRLPSIAATEPGLGQSVRENPSGRNSVVAVPKMMPGSQVFAAAQVASLCDDFVRGALNDLLPPVKGCRVFGGSISNTKYTLMPL